MTNILLGFHVLGAVCFFVGGIAVGVLQLKAIRQERPSQVYAHLRRAPFGAALVGTGALLTLGFGIALAEHKGIGLSPAWIQASLGLWVLAMALGAFGGRTARHARHLAKKLAAEGDAPSPELRATVSARGPLLASYASFLLLIAIVVLMVWQPGSPGRFAIPAPLHTQIVAGNPRIAYVPTRVPNGYSLSRYTYRRNGYELVFMKGDGAASEVDFFVEAGCAGQMTGAQQRLRLNGDILRYHYGEDGHQVWLCENGVLRQATTFDYDSSPMVLATLVAYAEPLR